MKLNFKNSRSYIIAFMFFIFVYNNHLSSQMIIAYNTEQEPVNYAITKLQNVLIQKGYSLQLHHGSQITSYLPDILVITNPKNLPGSIVIDINEDDFKALKPEGYEFRWINNRKTLLILSKDEIGAQYGVLDLAEHIQLNDNYKNLKEKIESPTFEYRIVKFNLPWSPYRVSEATKIHMHVVRDIGFWEKFLDMMVENRLNTLSLWNNHPFPFMIRSKNFPEATPFNDQEMLEWQRFWKTLFKKAKQRGIQTFIVNWNIVVSPEFAEIYNAKEYNDLSETVIRYTRESVTQLINEYEDLTGLGVTLADWMGTFNETMTPQQRENWIEKTFIEGIKSANREVKFIHRSVLAGDPMAMRNLIDKAELEDPVLVEIKFNWSHGHSSPNLSITHDYHSGELDERFWKPFPENYKIQWMIRNEDFFILRWGQPEFIRKHIETNYKKYVNGYFIGSEGYIPALDYSHKKSPIKTWQYAFEKQWLFYKLWGRLLYSPNTPDEVFALAFEQRYGKGIGESLLLAYKLASNFPLRLASFHRSTWDYTLYSEGFISAAPSSSDFYDKSSPFISIDQLIYHETLDPALLSIPDFLDYEQQQKSLPDSLISPLTLANLSENDSRKAIELAESLYNYTNEYSGALKSELDDILTWGYLGLYFADKLRAGVALEKYRTTGETDQKETAIQFLELCLKHWDKIIYYTKDRYLPTPHVSTERWGKEFDNFSWESLRPQVERDLKIAQESTFKD